MAQVPPPEGGMKEVVHIQMFVDETKIHEKQVLIQSINSGTFVQTDKPIYTPGQLGKEPGAVETCLLGIWVCVQAFISKPHGTNAVK